MSNIKKSSLTHLKNIFFIHDKYNSYENINLDHPNPETQRANPQVKKRFNILMNHVFYYGNNSFDADNSSPFHVKKITSPKFVDSKQKTLKKIFIDNKTDKISNHNYSNIIQTKKKTSNINNITDIKKEYPKNYNFYERKETSNNKKIPKELLKHKKSDNNLFFNSNTPLSSRILSSDRYQQPENNNEINPNAFNNNINSKQNINLHSHNYNNNTEKLTASENYYKNNIKTKPKSTKNIGIYYSNKTINENYYKIIKPKNNYTSIPQKEIAFTYCKTDNISLFKKNYSTKNIYQKQSNEKISINDNYLSPKVTLNTASDSNLSADKISNKLKNTTKVNKLSYKLPNRKLKIKTDIKNNNNLYTFEQNPNINTINNDIDSHSKTDSITEANEKIITNKILDKKNKNLSKIKRKVIKINKLNNNSHIKIFNKNNIHLTSITNINNNSISNTNYNNLNNSNNKKNINTEKTPTKPLIKIIPNDKKPKQKTYHRLSNKQINYRKYYTIPEKTETQKNISNNINNIKNDLFEQEWNSEKFMGRRKQTYDVKRKNNKQSSSQPKKSDNNIKMYFVPNIYIKDIKAATQAGREESHFTKTNQDTYLIEKNINGILNYNLFGVFDGHGPYGHFASQFVSKYISSKLKNHPKLKYLEQPIDIYHKIKEKNFNLIEEIFLNADKQIQSEKFNSYLSGTTVVIVIQIEEHLICANCGDSRAIIIIDEDYNNNLINSKIIPLSIDCKPELLEEKKRIMKNGGIVEKSENEFGEGIGPYRVWDGDNDYPGLAMSRSIGDLAAKKVGVIPNPKIMEYIIDYYSKYLIICSDGVWEFLSNKDVMDIGNEYYLRNDASGLCQKLIKKATQCWEEEDCVIDDITVVTVFF